MNHLSLFRCVCLSLGVAIGLLISAASPQVLAVVSQSAIDLPEGSRQDGPKALLFVKGAYCAHCMAHLKTMANSLPDNVEVSVVSASDEDDLKNFPDLPFQLISDPQLKLFTKFGLVGEEIQHGTILLDEDNREIYRYSGRKPLTDATAVLAAVGRWEARRQIARMQLRSAKKRPGEQPDKQLDESLDQRGHTIRWASPTSENQAIASSDLLGQSYLLVLLEDLEDPHCAQALNLVSQSAHFWEQMSVPTVFVVARSNSQAVASLMRREAKFKFLVDPVKSVWTACHLDEHKSPVCILVCSREGSLQSLHYRANAIEVHAIVDVLKQLDTKSESESSE